MSMSFEKEKCIKVDMVEEIGLYRERFEVETPKLELEIE